MSACTLHDERKACTNLCKRLAVQPKPCNQTIDGVPRELLWKALNGSSKEIAIAQNELRALLDAPK